MQPLSGEGGGGDGVCVGRDIGVNWKSLQTTFIKGKVARWPVSSNGFILSNGDVF